MFVCLFFYFNNIFKPILFQVVAKAPFLIYELFVLLFVFNSKECPKYLSEKYQNFYYPLIFLLYNQSCDGLWGEFVF